MLKPKKKVKVTRKDLKEDKFVLSVFKVQEFLSENVKPIVIGVSVIILIVALFTYISRDRAQRNVVASKILTEATSEMENGNESVAMLKLDTISNKYDDTHVAELANLKLAKKYLGNLDYENAKKYFLKVVNDGGDIDFVLAAGYAGLGDCYFHEEDYEAAAEQYRKASHAMSEKGEKAELLFSAALAYQQMDDVAKVKELLQVITEKYADTRIKNKAEKILSAIK